MNKEALGLIEVVGLAAGIEAADAAIKAANVELLGYELTKGSGMTVIKLSGDVGAVKAAVDAAAASAAKVSKVYATHVIPRPATDLEKIVLTKETVGRKTPATAPVPQEPAQVAPTVNQLDTVETKGPTEKLVNRADLCNLCGDPICQRKKGEPRATCIHYPKHKKEDE